MTLAQLKSIAAAQPFRPFSLETIGGNYLAVDKVDHVLFPPPDRDVIIVFGADGLIHHVTLDQINTWAMK